MSPASNTRESMCKISGLVPWHYHWSPVNYPPHPVDPEVTLLYYLDHSKNTWLIDWLIDREFRLNRGAVVTALRAWKITFSCLFFSLKCLSRRSKWHLDFGQQRPPSATGVSIPLTRSRCRQPTARVRLNTHTHTHTTGHAPPSLPLLFPGVDYGTIRDAILTCARKPTWVSLIYRTETTTEKCKTEKKLKSNNGYSRK